MPIDAVLVVALAAISGAFVVIAPAAALLASAVALLLLRRDLGRRALVTVIVAMMAGGLRASAALSTFEETRIGARDALGPPARCALYGTVETSPVMRGGTLSYLVATRGLDCGSARIEKPVHVRLYGGPPTLARGDRIEAVAQLGALRLFRNAELPDPVPRAARARAVLSGGAMSVDVLYPGVGLGALMDRARAHARARIEATFSPAAAPMARALVLGENDLQPDEDEAFRMSGLSHLLAVSGTHLVFAVVTLVKMLEALAVRIEPLAARMDSRRIAAGIGAVLALAYADFAGGSGSAWRAAWMLTAALLVSAIGRRPRLSRSFAASLFVGWVADPLVAFDISFVLSAGATAGLVVIGQALARRVEGWRPRPLRYLATATIATIASMIPCAPLLALLAPTLTLAGILANLVAGPLGELIALPLCLIHPLATPLPVLERGVALVASGALRAVAYVAYASAGATWSAVHVPPPGGFHFAVLAAGVCALLTARQPRGRLAAGFLAALGLVLVELAAIAAGRPLGRLRVTALDVEQGDATLVDLPDGKLMLIDGGGFVGSPVDPGRQVLLPLLRARRRSHVDIAVLSHPHPDHFGGLATALPAIGVGELWDSGQGRGEGAGPVFAEMMRALDRRGVAIRGPGDLCGKQSDHGGAILRVLGPCPGYTPGLDANDNSIVLHVRYGNRAVLLTGDAEAHQEATLIAQHGDGLRADVLKVGHHGSRTSSTPAFVDRVRPAWATISCGVRNRYGHPHAVTLETLERAGVSVLRLDRTGSVTFVTDGSDLQVSGFSTPK